MRRVYGAESVGGPRETRWACGALEVFFFALHFDQALDCLCFLHSKPLCSTRVVVASIAILQYCNTREAGQSTRFLLLLLTRVTKCYGIPWYRCIYIWPYRVHTGKYTGLLLSSKIKNQTKSTKARCLSPRKQPAETRWLPPNITPIVIIRLARLRLHCTFCLFEISAESNHCISDPQKEAQLAQSLKDTENPRSARIVQSGRTMGQQLEACG